MARYKSTAKLNTDMAAYIAGLVDGEGTVTLTRMHRNENRRIVVAISNNERSMLDYVIDTVGAGRITRKRTYDTAHAPSFTFQLSGRQALELLRQIVPYLRTYKAARARLALANYLRLTPRNGRYDTAIRDQRARFEQEFLAIQVRRSARTEV